MTTTTKKNLFTSTIAGMMGMIWFAIAFGMPTSMLFEAMTGSGFILGIFTTFTQLTAFFQLPSVVISEYFPNRKRYWGFVALCNRSLWISPVILILLFWDRPNLAAILLVILLSLASCFGHIGGPIWLDWMADMIPSEISERYWGIRQSLTSALFFITTIAAGYLLDIFPGPDKLGGSYNGFLLVFTIAAVAGVCDTILHLQVPDTTKTRVRATEGILQRFLTPLKNSDFRNMTFACASWFLAISIIGPFGFIYLKRVFNAPYIEIAIISSAASLSAVIFGVLNGIIIDKIGARAYFCIALAIVPITWSAWFFVGENFYDLSFLSFSFRVSEPLLFIALSSFIGGIFGSGIAICQLHLTNALSEKSWRRFAIAEHWSMIGIISAIGPFIGGAITDYFTRFPSSLILPSGKPFSFIHILIITASFVCWFMAVPFMLKVKIKREDMQIASVISAVYFYPMRGFGLAMNYLRSILRSK